MTVLFPRAIRRLASQLVLTGVRFNIVLMEGTLAIMRSLLHSLQPTDRSTPEAGKAAPEAERGPEPSAPAPAVPIEKSVKPDRVVCLEDGKAFTTLKRHLRTAHGLTPAQYRAKWGLSGDYPLVAPRYAAARSKVAKQIGLGGRRAVPHGRKGKQTPRAQRQKAAESGGTIY